MGGRMNGKNALSDYLRMLYKIPVLTREEEYALWERIQNGDESAKEKLIEHNLRFVVLVVKSKPYWMNGSVPMEDLIQFGNMGLMEAANKWVPKGRTKFASFARVFIERYTNRGIENSQEIIRLPVNIGEAVKRMKYTEQKLIKRLFREPTYQEIADELKESVEWVIEHQTIISREPISINALLSDNITDDEDSYD
jgi:RNA polymerase primary sigma factor